MFQPMAHDGDLRARRRRSSCRSRSSRRWSRSCIRGRVKEKENFLDPLGQARPTSRSLRLALRLRWVVVPAAVVAFVAVAAAVHAARAGVRADARREGHRDARDAHPQHRASRSRRRCSSTSSGRSSTFPEVAFVFSKTGTAEMASDPMPPNVSDTFIILKPQSSGAARPNWTADRAAEKELEQLRTHEDEHGTITARHADRRPQGQAAPADRADAQAVPGNNYEFTQPIQMRFNELIAGVRGDVAVKVYGDDFEQMQQTAAADRHGAAGRARRGRREGRADRGPADDEHRDRPRRHRALRPERRRRAGCGRHRDRRTRGRAGLRRRPALRPRRSPARRRCAATSRRWRTCRSRCPSTDEPQAAIASDDRRCRGRAGLRPARRRSRRSRSPKARTRSAARTASGAIVVQANVRGRDIGSFVDEAQQQDRPAGEASRRATGSTGAGSSRTSSPPGSGC